MTRRTDGRETWHALLNWDKGPMPSERLAGILLSADGYESVDPSHPLGGKDGKKDLQMAKDGLQLIGAIYFPRGQQSFTEIKNKFAGDLKGVESNKKNGIVFFTNQELRLAERNELQQMAGHKVVEIYHLERIALLLNTPSNYGIRTEFLDIDMTNAELVALYAQRDKQHLDQLASLSARLDDAVNDLSGYVTGGDSYPSFHLSRRDENHLHFLVTVNGKYPLYEVKISIKLGDGLSNNHLHKFINDGAPAYVHAALTERYAQVIDTFQKPTEFPLKFSFMTYARNGVYRQTLDIVSETDGSYLCKNKRIYRVNGGIQTLIVQLPDQTIS